jgi:hypothetical protein
MTIPYGQRSVVAIDPTPRGIAYVFFENGELLDCSQRGTTAEEREILAAVDEVLDGCAADVLVLEDPDVPSTRRHPRMQHVLRLITSHVRKRGIPVVQVEREEVRASWAGRGVTTKEAIAAAIAERYPLLAPFVPPPRKYPDSEDARVNLFDAASIAIALLDDPRSADSSADLLAP